MSYVRLYQEMQVDPGEALPDVLRDHLRHVGGLFRPYEIGVSVFDAGLNQRRYYPASETLARPSRYHSAACRWISNR